MLHRTMDTKPMTVLLGLEDLLGDLQHARRTGDLGRLALLAYCEVRRWARQAGELALAEHSAEMFTKNPHTTRAQFLEMVDGLISELAQTLSTLERRRQASADGEEAGTNFRRVRAGGVQPIR